LAVSNAVGAIVNIGFESLPILVVYAGTFVLPALPLAPFGPFSRIPLDALP
jgi:hypothetical protein